MNIGIISMQRVMNYGSFLQAYALKNTIESFGHNCEFIDIEKGKIFPDFKCSVIFILLKIIERILKYDFLKRILFMYRFHNSFNKYFFNMLGVNKHFINHFDLVVIGSDEVFNFAQRVPWGFTLQLYGKVKHADKVISYAGSFGHTSMSDIEYYGVKDEIKDALITMDAISVRDKNSYNIVYQLTGIKPYIHIDPVLMFDYSPLAVTPSINNYIIIYSYPNRIKIKKEIDAIRSFARKYNKKLVSIGFYFSWCDSTVIPTPFEVLGYIKNADYIITDTFHGAVMSIKFNRPFVVLVRNTNKQKLESLLFQFNLGNRIVVNVNDLENIIMKSIDFDQVNLNLCKERMNSLNYLRLFM